MQDLGRSGRASPLSWKQAHISVKSAKRDPSRVCLSGLGVQERAAAVAAALLDLRFSSLMASFFAAFCSPSVSFSFLQQSCLLQGLQPEGFACWYVKNFSEKHAALLLCSEISGKQREHGHLAMQWQATRSSSPGRVCLPCLRTLRIPRGKRPLSHSDQLGRRARLACSRQEKLLM